VPLTSQLWTRVLRGARGVRERVRDLSGYFPAADHLNQTGWADVAEGGGLLRSLFSPRAWKRKRAYEARIRAAYGKIVAGLPAGVPRDPVLPATEADIDKIKRTFDSLGISYS